MSLAYTISGIDKLMSASWFDGSAIHHLLTNPLARNTPLRLLFLELPKPIIQLMTWSILAIEVLFLPLALTPKTRKWIWFAMVLMHLGILVIVDFADLTFGMLMIHLFTFDENWFSSKKNSLPQTIFFDGVCGLCNRFINFILDVDKNKVLKFSPLQGKTAASALPSNVLIDLKTVVFLKNNKIYTQSDAVLEIFKSIDGIWSIFYIFKWIPKFIRDFIYHWISSNRIKWFGQLESCRMPTKEERDRFLD
jgi:predicted DCC family thiol-disulfide oxidoreductase YuxK